jgi:hypothetical protein
VGPAPGGGLPLRQHCDRPQGVLPLPQQTSSDGDVGGTKQPPPARTRCVPAAVALCVPSAKLQQPHAPLLRTGGSRGARAVRGHPCPDAAELCQGEDCSGWVLPVLQWRRRDVEPQPTGTCTHLHHCHKLLPALRIRVGASHAHRAAPTSHACEATPRTCSASSICGAHGCPHNEHEHVARCPQPMANPNRQCATCSTCTTQHVAKLVAAAGAAPCGVRRAEACCCLCRMTCWLLRGVVMRAR